MVDVAPTAEQDAVRPEDLDDFRQLRLLLLLDVASADARVAALDLDRMGYYDFFASNPFLVTEGDLEVEHLLTLAGFTRRNLSYQSSAQRFSNRRARLKYDLARLTSLQLVNTKLQDGRVTFVASTLGASLADQASSVYAQAYRKSAKLIIDRLRLMSDGALRDKAREWLRAEPFLIDIYE